VLNLDDERVAGLAGQLPFALGFTVRGVPGAALSAEQVRGDLSGVRFRLRSAAPLDSGLVEVESPLIGAHNVENLLAAIGVLAGSGIPLRELAYLAAECGGAPGRLERVPDPAGRVVLVDYAHTDDALARVLDALRKASAPRIVCVFGCGGDRDRGKRPLMGEAAGTRADLIVATGVDRDESADGHFALAPVVDISPIHLAAAAQHLRRPPRDGAGGATTNALYARLAAVAQPGYVDPSVPLHPARAVAAARAALPDGGLVSADPGVAGLWFARAFPTSVLGSVLVPATRAPGIAAAPSLRCRDGQQTRRPA